MHAYDVQGDPQHQRGDQHHPKPGNPLEQITLPRPGTILDGANHAAPDKISAQDEEDDDGHFADRSAIASNNVIGGSLSWRGICCKRREEQAPRMPQKDNERSSTSNCIQMNRTPGSRCDLSRFRHGDFLSRPTFEKPSNEASALCCAEGERYVHAPILDSAQYTR